ncbi:MAG TPA: hypothetical protein DDW52_13110 [Planctomycetaceae bacterium]|nr:hypothetical protein [Planctomycetaceae bacterium]
MNPYESSISSVADTTYAGRRWPTVLGAVACLYYGASALSLPFANAIWLGEIPLLATVQVPKSFLKSVVHDGLLCVVHALGLSSGSASPDYSATHGWAMLVMVAAPALLIVFVLGFWSHGQVRTRLVAAVLLLATLDALVTFWFDSSYSLELYNASYF